MMNKQPLETDPLWFKQAIIYQVHVKGFYDRNEDGIGDFAGLREKLDYLESLGITAIWLLPFYPSPLKDDGYDIANYYNVHPIYGYLNDFRHFLKEAHHRGIRVITELVINHTSDQHPWFQRARHAKPGSAWRNFYVWSDTVEKYKEAPIIFRDFETSNWTWDPVAQAYYWHRFYSHQPDLNFENPLVRKEVFRALDFWFEMGVDGLRLDAISYLFEEEGTSCDNLPATHDFIKKLRQRVDAKFKDRVLIAEANHWPEDAVAFFGNGDECHMAFHFPVMPRLFMAIHMEDRYPIIDILEQTPLLPPTCQWVMFLRNHDELTLEMVSDEERDYMYRIYAKDPKARINLGIRRRLAPLLDNDRAKIELMNILLFSLPGTPVIYYGDEIGMGDNYYLGDRNGVRTPMQWSPDRNAGFSKANPQRLYLPIIIDPSYHYEVVNVENQESNSSSLLWWTRRTLLVRKNCQAFGRGDLEFLTTDNSKILAFTRTYQNEIILVVANLSHFAQAAGLDMTKYVGYIPIELFHQTQFPKINDKTYYMTLGPHGYFWLSLKPSEAINLLAQDHLIPTLYVERNWENIFKESHQLKLEKDILPLFLKTAQWFERKTTSIHSIKILFTASLPSSKLCIIEIRYLETEERDVYFIPIAFAPKPESDQLLTQTPKSILAHLHVDHLEGVLYDGAHDAHLRADLLNLILKHKKIKLDSQAFVASIGEFLKNQSLKNLTDLSSSLVKEGQSTSSFLYESQFFLKIYRKLDEGINPEVEIQTFLSETAKFPYTPQFAGKIEWQRPNKDPIALAILESAIPHEESGWSFTLDALTSYYERVLAYAQESKQPLSILPNPLLPKLEELIRGSYLEAARLLGQRTAEMHLALASHPENSQFRPELSTTHYQRSIYQTMRRNVYKTLQLLKLNLNNLPASSRLMGEEILKSQSSLMNFYQRLLQVKMTEVRIRVHGYYHLGKVLYTGKDFYIIDFEGKPLLPISHRRIKRSSLRDVAGMLRSFHHAAHHVLLTHTTIKPDLIPQLEPWADLWYQQVSTLFVESYTQTIQTSPLPFACKNPEECRYLLDIFLLDKAMYELSHALNTCPDEVVIPCKGILHSLKNKF